MTKLKIGTRVRDNDGDEGVIVGKSKGYRDVTYETGGCKGLTVPALSKDFLTPIADNDNAVSARPEVCDFAYKVGDRVRYKDRLTEGEGVIVAASDAAVFDWTIKPVKEPDAYFYRDDRFGYRTRLFKSANLTPVVAPATTPAEWVPAVGDRVVVVDPSLMRDGTPVGAEGIVTRTYVDSRNFGIDLTHPTDGVIEQYVSASNVQPLPVAEQPAGDDRADAGGGFKAGDRIRLTSGELPLMPLGSEFVAVARRDGGVATSVHFKGTDGHITWRPGSYFELVTQPAPTPPTTWAPVVGKFGKTRDGRKVGPIRANNGEYTTHSGYDFVAGDPGTEANQGSLAWRANGKWGLSDKYEDAEDLVAEWVEPEVAVAEATATEREFIVGTRIRRISEGRRYAPIGFETFVSEPGYFRDADGDDTHLAENFWEIFEPAAPTAKFKVGDKVRPVNDRYGWVTAQWDAYWKSSEGPAPRGEFFIVGNDEGYGYRISAKSNGEGPYWSADFLELVDVAPDFIATTLLIGSTVTFTATGRLSAINENGHYQVTFPGLEPGQNSFAVPAKYVALAN